MARNISCGLVPKKVYFIKKDIGGDRPVIYGPYKMKPTLVAREKGGLIQEYTLEFSKEYEPKEKED